MANTETLQDALDAAIMTAMLDMACLVVADQGVEIHQWLRDEKARGLGGKDDDDGTTS